MGKGTQERKHPAVKLLGDSSTLKVSPKLQNALRDWTAAALMTRLLELLEKKNFLGPWIPVTDAEWAEYLRCSSRTVRRKRHKLGAYGLETKHTQSSLHNEPHVCHYRVDVDRMRAALGLPPYVTTMDQSDWPDWARDP